MIDIIQDTDMQTLMTGKHKDGIPYLEYVFRVYEELFNKPCVGCVNNIPEYIKAIKNYKPMRKNNKDLREFRLRKGVILPVRGTREVYSDYNLSDEIALTLISENPNRKSLFEVIPENLEDLLKIKSKSNTNDMVLIFDKPHSIEEAKELLELIGAETRAKTPQGILKKIEELSNEQNTELAELVSNQ